MLFLVLARRSSAPAASTLVRIARIAALSALSKGPGFLIPIVLAAGFGAGASTDAYFLAYGAALLAGGAIGTAMENGTVPRAAQAARGGAGALSALVRAFERRALLWGLVAAVAGGALLVAGVTLARPSGVTVAAVLAIYLLLAPSAIAAAAGGVYSGTLMAGNRLELAVASNGVRGLGALGGAVAASAASALWPLAIGLTAGECARTLLLRGRIGLMPASAASSDAAVDGALLRQAAAQVLLAGGPLIERLIVAHVGSGAVSHVEYAARLVMVVSVVFDGGAAPYLLSRWSAHRASGTLSGRTVKKPLAIAALAAGGFAAGLALAAGLLVRALLARGAFHAGDVAAVTTMLRLYAVAFAFSMTAICAERALLARGENGRFLRLTVARVATRLVAVACLVAPLSQFAAPIGFSLAEALYVALLVGALTRTRTQEEA